jgi:hypothetical protein
MIPLLQSVRQEDDFANLDTTNEQHQEYIIANALQLQGLDQDTIIDEIADLKQRGKLEERSNKLKPILEKYSAEQTQIVLQQQEEKNAKDQAFWNNHYNKLNTDLISAKDIDGLKFKQDDKNLIANVLLPNQELGGLPIYTIIDNLVGEGNIKLLSKLALLAANEEAFDNYYGVQKIQQNTKSLQRTLRSAVKANSDNDDFEVQKSTQLFQKNNYGNFMK